jgi:hypothetical protein
VGQLGCGTPLDAVEPAAGHDARAHPPPGPLSPRSTVPEAFPACPGAQVRGRYRLSWPPPGCVPRRMLLAWLPDPPIDPRLELGLLGRQDHAKPREGCSVRRGSRVRGMGAATTLGTRRDDRGRRRDRREGRDRAGGSPGGPNTSSTLTAESTDHGNFRQVRAARAARPVKRCARFCPRPRCPTATIVAWTLRIGFHER